MQVLQTDRLTLRWFGPDDAESLVALLNDPDWLRHIGDRFVRTVEQARAFIADKLVPPCWTQGHGFWAVERRDNGAFVGMAGLAQRDFLPEIDVGYALLPAHRGRGFAREAAAACVRYAHDVLGRERVLAMVSPQNAASIALLGKLGFARYESRIVPGQSGGTDVYEWCAPSVPGDDRAQIDALAARFFAAFTNVGGAVPTIASLPFLFTADARIAVVAADGAVTSTDVRGFVEPRAELLLGGRLRDFVERETAHETRVHGALAQRWSRYSKAGVRDGVPFAATGQKALQCVRTARGWRIAALQWQDDDARPE